MALGPGDIATYRNREWTQTYSYLARCNLGAMTLQTHTIAGITVKVHLEGGNARQSLHLKSIKTAIADLVAGGKPLPASMDFYLTSAALVPNVAMKTYAPDGTPTPVIFLGPNMWVKNPMNAGTNVVLVGGMGPGGARGVADQAYDGTTRFFGNPKQKAQGACIVVHELGHVLHEMNDPGVFWEEQRAAEQLQPSPNGVGWQNASIDVSCYGGKNALEFVAEVFTGLMIGKNYAGHVLNSYAALGGPP